MNKLLLVDNDINALTRFSSILNHFSKYVVFFEAHSAKEAAHILHTRGIDMVLVNLREPIDDMLIKFLVYLVKKYPYTKRMIVDHSSSEPILQRIKMMGPAVILHKPESDDIVFEVILEQLNLATGGFVRNISITSFAQMIELDRKTCKLHVTAAGKVGFLYFKEGHLIAAESSMLRGEKAALEIFSWEHALIRMDNSPNSKEKQIHQPLMSILLQSGKIKDDQKGPNQDHRKYIRFNCDVATEYDTADGSYKSTIRDISFGGAYVESNQSVDIGSEILLNIGSHQLQKYCTINGKIVRRDAKGFGVKFENLSLQQQNIILSLTQQN